MELHGLSLLLVMLLLLRDVCLGETNYTCSLAKTKSVHLRLKNHLFCNYDKMVRPIVHHKNATDVGMSFAPLRIDFIDKSSRFILHTWNTWVWVDEFLNWKPKDFDGINETHVKSVNIWTPDFALYNSADMTKTQIGIPNVPCILLHSGVLICPAPVTYDTHCTTDFTHWPYDEQTCSVRISSWEHHGGDVNINFNKSSIDMDYYSKNNEWDLKEFTLKKDVKYYKCCPKTYFLTIIPTFLIRRHPSMVHVIFVTPAFVFIIITLTALYLDVHSNERILLVTMNFVCHMLIICTLHWVLPQNGAKGSPHLLLFYRDSWMIATFTIVLTILLRKLQSNVRTVPDWLIFATALIENNRVCRIFLMDKKIDSDDVKQLVISVNDVSTLDVDEQTTPQKNSIFQNSCNQTCTNDSWWKVAIIIKRLAFICVSVTYLLLIILFIPRA